MKDLTGKQAKQMIKEAGGSWEVFEDWMIGQTAPFVNGRLGYFRYDVERFIRYKCDPKNEPYIEWD